MSKKRDLEEIIKIIDEKAKELSIQQEKRINSKEYDPYKASKEFLTKFLKPLTPEETSKFKTPNYSKEEWFLFNWLEGNPYDEFDDKEKYTRASGVSACIANLRLSNLYLSGFHLKLYFAFVEGIITMDELSTIRDNYPAEY